MAPSSSILLYAKFNTSRGVLLFRRIARCLAPSLVMLLLCWGIEMKGHIIQKILLHSWACPLSHQYNKSYIESTTIVFDAYTINSISKFILQKTMPVSCCTIIWLQPSCQDEFVVVLILHLSYSCGGALASWLVRSTPDQVVQVWALAGVIVLCF